MPPQVEIHIENPQIEQKNAITDELTPGRI